MVERGWPSRRRVSEAWVRLGRERSARKIVLPGARRRAVARPMPPVPIIMRVLRGVGVDILGGGSRGMCGYMTC